MNADSFQKTFEFINSLGGLPKGSLVFLWCIAFGFVMKRLRWVDNRSIPLFVILWGCVWLPALSDFRSSPIETVRIYIFSQIAVGGIVGLLSTFSYRAIRATWKKLSGSDIDDSDPPWPNKDGSNVCKGKPPLASPVTPSDT